MCGIFVCLWLRLEASKVLDSSELCEVGGEGSGLGSSRV